LGFGVFKVFSLWKGETGGVIQILQKMKVYHLIVQDSKSGLRGGVPVIEEGDVAPHPPHIVEIHQGRVKTDACTLSKDRAVLAGCTESTPVLWIRNYFWENRGLPV